MTQDWQTRLGDLAIGIGFPYAGMLGGTGGMNTQDPQQRQAMIAASMMSLAGNLGAQPRGRGVAGAFGGLGGAISDTMQQGMSGGLRHVQMMDYLDKRRRTNATREWLRQNAQQMGLSPELVDAMDPEDAAKLWWQESMRQRERKAQGAEWRAGNPQEDWERGGGSQPPATPAPNATTPQGQPGPVSQVPSALSPMIAAASEKYGVPRELLTGLLAHESAGFRPDVMSGEHTGAAGEKGVGQFIPGTAKMFGIDPRDHAQSIDAAARYLAQGKAQTGSWDGALASYNRGFGGVPQNPSALPYVRDVMRRAAGYRAPPNQVASLTPQTATDAAPAGPPATPQPQVAQAGGAPMLPMQGFGGQPPAPMPDPSWNPATAGAARMTGGAMPSPEPPAAAMPTQAPAPAAPQASQMPPEVQQQIKTHEANARTLAQSARARATTDPRAADAMMQRAREAWSRAQDIRAQWAMRQEEAGRQRFSTVTTEDGVYTYDPKTGQLGPKLGERPQRNEGEGRDFTQARQLRGEFTQATKDFAERQTAYSAMVELAKQGEGASDIALIFSLMKVYDPTSTVTAGEAANAKNAAGVPEQVQALYNKLITGEGVLTDSMRLDLVNAGRQRFEQEHRQYGRHVERYGELADLNKIDRRQIVTDYRDPERAPERGAKQIEAWRKVRSMTEGQLRGLTREQIQAMTDDEREDVIRRLERMNRKAK